MPPSPTDVQSMVAELFAVAARLQRARLEKRPAAALDLLQIIGGRDGIRPSAIAEERNVHRSHVTRLIGELEAADLVSVDEDPSDARSWLVSLTPAGHQEMRRLQQVGLERFGLFVADWDATEVRQLAELLHKLDISMEGSASRDVSGLHGQDAAAPRRRKGARRAEGESRDVLSTDRL